MRRNQESTIESFISVEELSRLTAYQAKLIHWNRKFALTSVPDAEIFSRLIAPSAFLGLEYSKMAKGLIADFGTGPGIPGMVMAILDSRNKYLLIEVNKKKAGFLKACILDPAINIHKNILVREERLVAGEWVEKVNRVVSRGAGPLLEICRLFEGKLSENGVLDIFKGEKAVDEINEIKSAYKASNTEILRVPSWFGNLQLIRIQVIK